MNLYNFRDLFKCLYFTKTEEEIDCILLKTNLFNNSYNWHPLGANESNYGVIENQQSSPIAALIEKITNSIDAILMRKCYEAEIDPKSHDAPQSMKHALEMFWPQGSENSFYDFKTLPDYQRKQSKEIQILADGPRRDTSLIIYDNGEGQHPEKFEDTFLSLLRGNKNEIHFVQGKYNMGGTGAIVFCGKKRYQLIASKRYDGTGKFGFTLIREHPLSEEEMSSKKNTWYEYLKIDGAIPAFEIDELDLGLDERNFKTGTIIKLYSYALPAGHSTVNRDLNQSINEFLFEPALPVSVIETKERYPNDNQLSRYLYGLKRRLENKTANDKYIERVFSDDHELEDLGKIKVTTYLFKNRVDGKNIKETRKTIQNEFFKNNMTVMFSVNGQVHGHYTSEFISRRLNFPIFKDYLLIHVDCTNMKLTVRKELFMASRDRLKESEETKNVREKLAKLLNDSELKALHKQRKESLSLSSEDTNDLLKSFTKSLPMNSDLMRLLNNTFKLDLDDHKKQKKDKSKQKHSKPDHQEIPFSPKRYPSFLKLSKPDSEGKPVAQIPLDGRRSIQFESDIEDEYFDRTDDPGELQISLLNHKSNETDGGDAAGVPKNISELINVTKSSPDKGKIRVALSPTKHVNAGDLIQVKASLKGAGEEFEQAFWIKIADKEQPKEKAPKQEDDEPKIGLPEFHLIYKEKKENHKTWDEIGEALNIDMDYEQVLHPFIDNDQLEKIFINMDSHVLLNKRKSCKTPAQIEVAEKRYISSVYFHSLFLFTISKKKKIELRQDGKDLELRDYIKDLFATFYSEFLLNFGIEELMDNLSV